MSGNIVVLGIDASLTGCAFAGVPGNWGLSWSAVHRRRCGKPLPDGASPREKRLRISEIGQDLLDFGRIVGATHAAIEGYAMRGNGRVFDLGELGGELKRVVIELLDIPLDVVPEATARALIGRYPTRARTGEPKLAPKKDRVCTDMTRAGMPTDWSLDEMDALLAANEVLSRMPGADAIILRQPDPPRAPRKRKARKCHYTKP